MSGCSRVENKNVKQLLVWILAFVLLIAVFQNLKGPQVEADGHADAR